MRVKLALMLLTGAIPATALATNGYFLPGFGVKSQGAGGVGIAMQADSLSQAANPANITETGMRGDLGLSLFNPERMSATGNATGIPDDDLDSDGLNDVTGAPSTGGFGFSRTSDSSNRLYLMPDMAFSMPLDSQLSVGIAMVGNGGMNTTYQQNFFGSGPAHIYSGSAAHGGTQDLVGVDLMQVLIPLTVAYKVTPEHSVGASVNLAAQRFSARGLGRFVQFGISSDSASLTNRGYDYSFGAGIRLGWLGKFMDDRVSMGATWASKTYMMKFDRYRGLFAEQGDFDIPENYGIGLALKPTKDFTVAADVVKIKYSGIASVSNPGPGIYNGSGIDEATILGFAVAGGSCFDPRCLGQDNGMGFGWKDMTIYKLGLVYDATDRLTLRAGYNYGKMPIRRDQAVFSALAPAVVEHHYSVGFTYKMKGELDWEISGIYMHAAENEVRENGQAVVDQVAYKMHQNVLGIGFGVKY